MTDLKDQSNKKNYEVVGSRFESLPDFLGK
jgi:hypothetical protein